MTSFAYLFPCPFTLLHLLPTKDWLVPWFLRMKSGNSSMDTRDLCCARGRYSNSFNLIAVFIYILRRFGEFSKKVQSWVIVVPKSDISFRSSPVSPHAKAKRWQMQCTLNIPLHSLSCLNLATTPIIFPSHYTSSIRTKPNQLFQIRI